MKNEFKLPVEKQDTLVRSIVRRVILGEGTVWIEIDRAKLLGALLQDPEYSSDSAKMLGVLRLQGKFRTVHRGNELRVVPPETSDRLETRPIPSLVNAVVRSRHWYDQIVAGKVRSISQLAAQTGLGPRHTRRILQCATLSPEVVDTLLTGKHRPDLTVNQILKKLPLDWHEQKRQILNVS